MFTYCKFENFREAVYSRRYASVKFRGTETLAKWLNHSLSFHDVGKPCPTVVAIFNAIKAIHENIPKTPSRDVGHNKILCRENLICVRIS